MQKSKTSKTVIKAREAAKNQAQRYRIDKWLWAARFFKTRSLAQAAVEGGKVRLNDSRCKPAKDINIDDSVIITKGEVTVEILVTALSQRRGSAKDAALLYQESEESVTKRTELASQRRLARTVQPQYDHRPNKHERRKLAKFRKWQPED